jgi:hypothetical protein
MSEYSEYFDGPDFVEFSHFTENTYNTFDVQDRFDSRYTENSFFVSGADRFTSRFTRYSPYVEDYSREDYSYFDYDTPRVNYPSRYSDFTPSYRKDSFFSVKGRIQNRFDYYPDKNQRYDYSPSINVRYDYSPQYSQYSYLSDDYVAVEARRTLSYRSFYSARSNFIDNVDSEEIFVKIERGYAGVCGVKYAFNVGDTYWCDDRQYGLRTHCQVMSSKLHLCCVDTDGCDDWDDMRPWRF